MRAQTADGAQAPGCTHGRPRQSWIFVPGLLRHSSFCLDTFRFEMHHAYDLLISKTYRLPLASVAPSLFHSAGSSGRAFNACAKEATGISVHIHPYVSQDHTTQQTTQQMPPAASSRNLLECVDCLVKVVGDVVKHAKHGPNVGVVGVHLEKKNKKKMNS